MTSNDNNSIRKPFEFFLNSSRKLLLLEYLSSLWMFLFSVVLLKKKNEKEKHFKLRELKAPLAQRMALKLLRWLKQNYYVCHCKKHEAHASNIDVLHLHICLCRTKKKTRNNRQSQLTWQKSLDVWWKILELFFFFIPKIDSFWVERSF